MPLPLQILSDLHLESPKAYDIYIIPVTCHNLALLGDIGLSIHPELFTFLSTLLDRYRRIFYIPGNHEPYHSSWEETKRRFSLFESQMSQEEGKGEFIFMTCRRYDIPDTGYTVLGCTLFSRIDPLNEEDVSSGVNDFYHISGWDTASHNAAHISDLDWLNSEVTLAEQEGREVVILTHHSPSISKAANNPVHVGSKIQSAFASDLSKEACWMSRRVRLWAWGHTHWNFEMPMPGGGKAVGNMRGYYHALKDGFEPGRVWEV
ncbi:ser/Thr protein phosphatase [Trichophaea hybrida]|nr:ser/Thr protein phosphatase [Trichophaea hybrida]